MISTSTVALLRFVSASVVRASPVIPRVGKNDEDGSAELREDVKKGDRPTSSTFGPVVPSGAPGPADPVSPISPPSVAPTAPPGIPPVSSASSRTEDVPLSTFETTSTTTDISSVTQVPTSTAFTSFSTIASGSSFLTFTTLPEGSSVHVTSASKTGTLSTSARLLTTTDTTSVIPASATSVDAMSDASSSPGGVSNRTLVITLSTVLSVVGTVVFAIGAYLCFRHRRKRAAFWNRGVTPIGDDEIATWKVNRDMSEKHNDRFTKRGSTTSRYTHNKAPSNGLIQYRPSEDSIAFSPRSFINRESFDFPQSPQSAVLARAPNARTGLTDEIVPGDVPFVATPKRQPSKLYKSPPNTTPTAHRTRSSRSSSVRSFADVWYGEHLVGSPRVSSDHPPRSSRGRSRVYSTSTAPQVYLDDSVGSSEPFTGLSPRPLHRTEIGRALG